VRELAETAWRISLVAKGFEPEIPNGTTKLYLIAFRDNPNWIKVGKWQPSNLRPTVLHRLCGVKLDRARLEKQVHPPELTGCMDLGSIKVLGLMDGDAKQENAFKGILFRVAGVKKGEFFPIACLRVALALFPKSVADAETQMPEPSTDQEMVEPSPEPSTDQQTVEAVEGLSIEEVPEEHSLKKRKCDADQGSSLEDSFEFLAKMKSYEHHSLGTLRHNYRIMKGEEAPEDLSKYDLLRLVTKLMMQPPIVKDDSSDEASEEASE
jgi:hypothetical protein